MAYHKELQVKAATLESEVLQLEVEQMNLEQRRKLVLKDQDPCPELELNSNKNSSDSKAVDDVRPSTSIISDTDNQIGLKRLEELDKIVVEYESSIAAVEETLSTASNSNPMIPVPNKSCSMLLTSDDLTGTRSPKMPKLLPCSFKDVSLDENLAGNRIMPRLTLACPERVIKRRNRWI